MEDELRQLTEEETVDFILYAPYAELMRELGERRRYKMHPEARTANGMPLLVAVLRSTGETGRLWGGRLIDSPAARRMDGRAVVKETVANVLWTLWGMGCDRGAEAKKTAKQEAKRKARRVAKTKTRREGGASKKKNKRKDANQARKKVKRCGTELRRVEREYGDMDRDEQKWLGRAYNLLYMAVRYEGVTAGLGITWEEYLELLKPLKPQEGEYSYKAEVYKDLTRSWVSGFGSAIRWAWTCTVARGLQR
jgi:hypothetical protein